MEKWEREKRCGESQKNDEEMLAFAAPFGEGENVFVEDMLAEESAEDMWNCQEHKATDKEFIEMLEEIEFSSRSRPTTPLQPPRERKKETYLGNKSGNEEGNEPVRKVNAKRKVAATNGDAQRKQKSRKKKRKKGFNLSNKKMVCKDFIKKTVSDAVKQYNMPHFDDTFGVKIHQLVYDFCKNYGKPHTIVSLVENIRKKEESEHLPFLSWIQHHLKKLDGETLLVWTEHKHADVAYSEPVLTSKEYLYDQTKRNNPNRLSEQFGKFSYVVPTENPVSYLYVFLRHCLHMDRL